MNNVTFFEEYFIFKEIFLKDICKVYVVYKFQEIDL